ncbi:MAG TPA: hypothetical protein VIH43_04515 [Chthoniobacterales bacterium]
MVPDHFPDAYWHTHLPSAHFDVVTGEALSTSVDKPTAEGLA